MPASSQDIDRGYKALFSRLHASGKPLQLTVGVHASDGSGVEPGGATILEVATYQEFGTSTIPERSFIRAWADENSDKNYQTLGKIGLAIVTGKGGNYQTGLNRAGVRFVAEIQARIVAMIPPPLAPATVANKGSSTPLIDTGQLKSSIRYKVGPLSGE